MIKYKSLEDLGVKREDCYTNWMDDVNPCGREDSWKEQRETYGIDERETWNWSDDYMDYVYIHLEMFNRVNIVDFENAYEVVEVEGQIRTIQSVIDEILNWFKTEYYPDKYDRFESDKYNNLKTDEDRNKLKNDLDKFYNEQDRILMLFSKIISHLNW